jgi:hypothetical protein
MRALSLPRKDRNTTPPPSSQILSLQEIGIVAQALVEKRLSLAHQNVLSLANFGSPATYMPAVMLTAGEFCSSPGIIFLPLAHLACSPGIIFFTAGNL